VIKGNREVVWPRSLVWLKAPYGCKYLCFGDGPIEIKIFFIGDLGWDMFKHGAKLP
jgi:hypothetical protein